MNGKPEGNWHIPATLAHLPTKFAFLLFSLNISPHQSDNIMSQPTKGSESFTSHSQTPSVVKETFLSVAKDELPLVPNHVLTPSDLTTALIT